MVIGKKFATANFLNFSIKSPFLFYEFKINGLYLQRVRFSELFTAADTFKNKPKPLRVR